MLRPRVLLAGMLATGSAAPAAAEPTLTHGPWGDTVSDLRAEDRVRRFLEAVAAGRGDEVAGPSLTIGPALWTTVGVCPCMEGGMRVEHRQVIDGRPVNRPARAYLRADVSRILGGDAMRVVADYFAAGAVTSATADERRRYHALIPWEIAGLPVVVVRVPDMTLVAEVAEDGSVFHVDILPA